MATHRKPSSEDAGSGEKNDASEARDKVRQSRLERKAELISRKQKLDALRWALAGIVFLLLMIGMYYYLTTLHPEGEGGGGGEAGRGGETKRREGGRGGGGGGKEEVKSGKDKTKKKTGNSEINKNSQTPKKPRSTDEAKGTKTLPKKEKREKVTKKSKEDDIPTIPLNEIRLLRRPIPAEDSDRPYIIEILSGDNLIKEERYSEALEKFNSILKMFPQSPRGLYGKGETLLGMAEEKSSNKLRDTAVEFFKDVVKSSLTPKDIQISALARLVEVNQMRGKFSDAVKYLEKLYKLDNEDLTIANRLGMGYLSAGQTERAQTHFKNLVSQNPDNHYAMAHLGFILFQRGRHEEALPLLMDGLRKEESVRRNARFYLYAGEALTRLNRSDEAQVLYSEAVSLNLFPSIEQRSLFNEPGLRAQPWWTLEETGYADKMAPILKALENITSEAVAVLQSTQSSSPPSSLLTLFSHGKKNSENCRKFSLTCSLLSSFTEATACKQGEVKFILVPPKFHTAPHTGPTNTRLEVVVGLSLPDDGLDIRMADDTRALREGGVLVYDDSFERELWSSSSSGVGLVLSLQVWHPDLPHDRRLRLTPTH